MQFTVFAISAFVTMRLDCNARRYRHSSRMRQRGIRVFIVGTAALPGCGPGTFHNRARNLTATTLVWIRHRLLAQWVAAQGALIVARAVLMALQLGASSFLYAAGSSGRGERGGPVTISSRAHTNTQSEVSHTQKFVAHLVEPHSKESLQSYRCIGTILFDTLLSSNFFTPFYETCAKHTHTP